jgi:glycosyltransferase involved in cell wall biosynthesis
MNARRAVIVSDQVGCGPDLVRNGENGYTFPCGDISTLAEALQGVLKDPVHCRRLGPKGRESISHWGFEEDLRGLKNALAYFTGTLVSPDPRE